MNNSSKLSLGKNVVIAAFTFYVEPNSTVTVTTTGNYSKIFYRYKAQENSEVKGVHSINEMPDFIKEYFGWEK